MPCGKFSLGFSRLFQAFQETPESRKNQYVPEIIPVRSSGLFFAHKEKPGKRGNFLLIFPGFLGNPGIKEEPGCASNLSGQTLRAFLHIRKSPESEEIFFPGSPGFSRNSWKARRARTLLAFPGFFLAFPYVQRSQESREFFPGIPGNSWLLFAGVVSV